MPSHITTKTEERNALQKIREILNTLEEGSYVRMAITTDILRMAEENIEYDFANSPDDMLEHAQTETREYRENYLDAKAYIENLSDKITEITEERDALEDQLRREKEAWAEANSATIALENRVSMLEDENLRLKAKLYDYMQKNEGR